MAQFISGSSITPRRNCFISYHHADQNAVDSFVRTFDHAWDVLTARGLGREMTDDIIDSNDTDYVMSRIRQDFLKGSSVTIVMIGRCTWARRYVDWEIQASLRQDRGIVPNGLLGVKLPSYPPNGPFPERFNANLMQSGQTDCYARWIEYPANVATLQSAVEAAFQRRTTHAHLIKNPQDRFRHNRDC